MGDPVADLFVALAGSIPPSVTSLRAVRSDVARGVNMASEPHHMGTTDAGLYYAGVLVSLLTLGAPCRIVYSALSGDDKRGASGRGEVYTIELMTNLGIVVFAAETSRVGFAHVASVLHLAELGRTADRRRAMAGGRG